MLGMGKKKKEEVPDPLREHIEKVVDREKELSEAILTLRHKAEMCAATGTQEATKEMVQAAIIIAQLARRGILEQKEQLEAFGDFRPQQPMNIDEELERLEKLADLQEIAEKGE